MKAKSFKLLSAFSGLLELLAVKNISTVSSGTMYQPKIPSALKNK